MKKYAFMITLGVVLLFLSACGSPVERAQIEAETAASVPITTEKSNVEISKDEPTPTETQSTGTEIIEITKVQVTPSEAIPTPETPESKVEPQPKKMTVFIDPGHQTKGDNSQEPVYPGAKETKAKVSSGTRGIATKKYEYVLNLEVALKLKEKLEESGYNVLMSRETNEVNVSNVERATMANDANADIVIRIHADGSDNGSAKGYSILIPGDAHIADEAMLANSRRLGEYALEAMTEYSAQPSRGLIVRNDLSGFNWLKVPGILIEMGFMSNASEDQLMATPAYQDQIVQALYDAVERYNQDKNSGA